MPRPDLTHRPPQQVQQLQQQLLRRLRLRLHFHRRRRRLSMRRRWLQPACWRPGCLIPLSLVVHPLA